MWCVAELTPDYIDRMEDVLNLYAKPLNKKEPVVCLDEKPVQLLKESRPFQAARPGHIAKRDSEYIRAGTANVYCVVEPKGGRHLTRVTPNRKRSEFAKMIFRTVRAYPWVKRIHIVMDNLNIHNEKSLIEYYGVQKGKRIWKRIVVHYTPAHGSWLNQAEIEIGIFSRQCLGGDRIGTLEELTCRARAWNKNVNRKKLCIQWKFTSERAKKCFHY
jgi:DDE superfamily endonuclease